MTISVDGGKVSLTQQNPQDDEIQRLQKKLDDDKKKLDEAKKAKVEAQQFAENQAKNQAEKGKYTLEEMVNDKSDYADVNAHREEQKNYFVDYVRYG